jgi:hypothetical protein
MISTRLPSSSSGEFCELIAQMLALRVQVGAHCPAEYISALGVISARTRAKDESSICSSVVRRLLRRT